MPKRPQQQLHQTWTEDADDQHERRIQLRIAIERAGSRGFSAYAYIDKEGGDAKDMLITSTEFADTGYDAYQELKGKLASERGITLDPGKPPEWLSQPEWLVADDRPPKPRRPLEYDKEKSA